MTFGKKILPLLGIPLLAGSIVWTGGVWAQEPQEVVRPGCEWMSTEEDVDAALEKHQQLTQKIENLGEEIRVEKTLACDGNKALITISYRHQEDFSKISEALDDPRYEASVEVLRLP